MYVLGPTAVIEFHKTHHRHTFPFATPWKSLSLQSPKYQFPPQRRYTRGGSKLRRQPQPTQDTYAIANITSSCSGQEWTSVLRREVTLLHFTSFPIHQATAGHECGCKSLLPKLPSLSLSTLGAGNLVSPDLTLIRKVPSPLSHLM